ncbi:acyltransferase [Paenibacillus macerans]|uniref:Acyltransferase family protein n=1 Tax=Paenibacillus macerans TaxID=44252 RepID=A0A090ZAK3_PAEMA|nr:acyltransferase [Paenibacillus macerans]KFN07637.1 acyltransferase family protein [Paenibacillus macerans]MBS5914701.1 acyltransferase [Paenibacillus macerans]MCY7559601.1 acyltransferase [Paenibacillus macerans]MEC0138478.1 acyltransferase [Paenibacillus macerans]MEC0155227.1 acyltransferase [Paenibacillus macerans]
MNKVVKERLPQLDIFRAIAIFAVIQVHSSSFAAAEQALTSPIYYFYSWMNIFFKFGTPTFIFLSSFVLFYNYYDRPINKELVGGFYKKRLLNIILPYILVSCCYFLVVAIQRHDLIANSKMYELQKLVKGLLTGTSYTHLYFVFISIQFYILFPLLLWLFKSFRNSKVLIALILPAGLAIQWAFVFLNKYHLHLPNKGSYAPTYMAYYFMGAAVAICFDRIKGWLQTDWRDMSPKQRILTAAMWIGWLAVAFTHIQLWHTYRLGLSRPNTFWFELAWNVQAMFSAMVLLRAAFFIHRRGSAFWKKALTRLGELSFAIYLFHPAVLLVYRVFRTNKNLPGDSPLYLPYIIGGSLCALFISWVFVQFCFRRLPFAWLFLGNVPASLRKKKLPKQPDGGQTPSVNANL